MSEMRTTVIAAAIAALAILPSCGTKRAACRDLPARLDPLTAELERVEGLEPRSPISGDAATCAAYGNASGEMEATTKKLGALARSIEDEPLRRRLLQFEEHASGWAAAAKRTQEACSRRNSSAMVAAMGELTHHGAQFRFVSADIISYCKRP